MAMEMPPQWDEARLKWSIHGRRYPSDEARNEAAPGLGGCRKSLDHVPGSLQQKPQGFTNPVVIIDNGHYVALNRNGRSDHSTYRVLPLLQGDLARGTSQPRHRWRRDRGADPRRCARRRSDRTLLLDCFWTASGPRCDQDKQMDVAELAYQGANAQRRDELDGNPLLDRQTVAGGCAYTLI